MNYMNFFFKMGFLAMSFSLADSTSVSLYYILYYIILHYITLYYITLHYINFTKQKQNELSLVCCRGLCWARTQIVWGAGDSCHHEKWGQGESSGRVIQQKQSVEPGRWHLAALEGRFLNTARSWSPRLLGAQGNLVEWQRSSPSHSGCCHTGCHLSGLIKVCT